MSISPLLIKILFLSGVVLVSKPLAEVLLPIKNPLYDLIEYLVLSSGCGAKVNVLFWWLPEMIELLILTGM